MPLGTLYGISVGTGDPELITVKGLRLLQQSPVVAFPAGIKSKIGVAQRTIEPWLTPQQIQLPLDFPYVQDDRLLNQAWSRAAETVWIYLEQGQDVAFACEGDVSFYSTFNYLQATLQALHPQALIAKVPGVCSPMAAAASLGFPLTILDQRLVILPALHRISELTTILPTADVVVLMKVSSVYEQVWQILAKQGLLETSSIVAKASLPEQVIYDSLVDRPHLALPYFSIMIIKIPPSPPPKTLSNLNLQKSNF